MHTSPVIASLIERVAKGDRAAFDQLYIRTSGKLYGTCLKLLGSRADADEALQETYLKVWRRAASFTPGLYSPISWLAMIARNQAIDMLRARAPSADDIADLPELRGSGPSPEDATLIACQRRQVDLLIDGLDALKRPLVRDAYVEGLSYDQLAAKYLLPVNTVRTRLRRGLLELRDQAPA